MARGDGFSIIKRRRRGRELEHWQVRVQVPLEWRQIVGCSEVLRSTGTSERRIAAQLAPAIVTELHGKWRGLAGKASPAAAEDPRSVAVRVGYDSMLDALEDRRRTWPASDAEYAAKLAQRKADLLRMTRWLQDGDLSRWRAMADRSIAKHGLPFVEGTDEYTAFVLGLAEANIDAVGTFNRQHAGELDAAPRSTLVRDTKARDAAKAQSGETLIELFEAWGAEMLAKGQKRVDTVNQDRKVIEQFSNFVGGSRDVRSISPLEVAEYRDTLRTLPPKWMSKRELRGHDMRSAAAKSRQLQFDETAFTTINKHLSTISPLYKWIARHPKWAGMPNPVDGLFFDKVKGKNPRPPFSTDTLNKIFGSALFTGFKSDGKEHLSGTLQADDWRYWVPIACLFTGARIGEIAQLRLADVALQHGVWFFHIRHDSAAGLSTKSGETRVAAVHPILEQIGFLAFHQRCLEAAKGDSTAPMFPELEPNSRGQMSGKASRWWRDYLTDIGVKDGKDGKGSHSFRHTLTDRLRSEAGLFDSEAAIILGHSVKTTTGGYGKLSQLTVAKHKTYMDAVRFDGVTFEHLVAGGEARRVSRNAAIKSS